MANQDNVIQTLNAALAEGQQSGDMKPFEDLLQAARRAATLRNDLESYTILRETFRPSSKQIDAAIRDKLAAEMKEIAAKKEELADAIKENDQKIADSMKEIAAAKEKLDAMWKQIQEQGKALAGPTRELVEKMQEDEEQRRR